MEYIDEIELQLYVKIIYYSPARQVPDCQNPSSPSYGDLGYDEELEFNLYIKVGNKFYEADNLMYDDKKIVEAVFKIARDNYDDAVMDSFMERVK